MANEKKSFLFLLMIVGGRGRKDYVEAPATNGLWLGGGKKRNRLASFVGVRGIPTNHRLSSQGRERKRGEGAILLSRGR